MIERNAKLEAARRTRGWSLEVASQKIGVHPQTLRKWEMGKSKPHGFRVYKISEVYETTPAALGIGHTFPPFFSDNENSFPLPEIFLPVGTESTISIEDLDLQLMELILKRKLDRQNLNYHALQLQIHQRINEYDEYMSTRQTQSVQGPARVQALHIVASIPIAAYLEHIYQQPLPVHPEDILTHCAGAITACWHIQQDENLVIARSFISGYLLILGEIFARYIHCQQAAAELIAQTCLLRTMLALQLETPHAGISYYTKALEFGQIAENSEFPPVAPTYPGPSHSYGKQPPQALKQIAESIWLLKPAPTPPDFPLVHAYLQSLASLYKLPLLTEQDEASFAKNQRDSEISGSDGEFFSPSLDYAATALHIWDGITYRELGAYAHALDDIGTIETSEAVSDAPEEIRLEFLPNRALAALRLHDMDQAITTLRAVVPQALSLGNEQQLVEARDIYHLMQFLIPNESIQPALKLKDLLKKHD